MKKWTTIKYREFYDIPRIFLLEHRGNSFLFDCRFNSDKDDYEKTYKVYLMPRLSEKELEGSWEKLPDRAERLLGEICTSEVEFDQTLRREVNAEMLGRFGF